MELSEVFSNSFRLVIETFAVAIPNLIKALIIIAIGYFISKSIYKIILTILSRAGVDKLGATLEEIDFVAKSGLKIEISKWVGKIVYLFLLLIFMVAATDILGMAALSNLVADTIAFIPNLLVAILTLIVGVLGADKLKKIVKSTCESLGIEAGNLIASFVFYFVFITVFIMALSQAKINTEFLATNLSIIVAGIVLAFSIGYGLASKETVANLLASRYSKDKFKIGDKIVYEGKQANITEIGSDAITLNTDESVYIIPMHKFMKQHIEILK